MKFAGGIFFGIMVVIIALVIISDGCDDPQPKPRIYTVQEYEYDVRNTFDRALIERDHLVRRQVESAHVTVKVRSAEVSYIKCQTYDGSNNAGEKGQNIKSIRMQITTIWDGIFHKNGKTVFEWTLGKDYNGEWKTQYGEIVETDAKINISDPRFWFSTGMALILLL